MGKQQKQKSTENMLANNLPEQEIERLEILRSTNLLDTEGESSFDSLTNAAAKLCDMPLSFICLVDTERVWFKSLSGMEGISEIPRDIGFCPHTIMQEGLFEVQNAALDPRFKDNPLVINEPNLLYYAGYPLVTHDGYALGTLCVMDYKPNQLDENKKSTLKNLSVVVTSLIEAKRIKESNRLSLKHRLGNVVENSLNEVYLVNSESQKIVYANRSALRNLGYNLSSIKKLNWEQIFEFIPSGVAIKHRCTPNSNTSPPISFEAVQKRCDGSTYPVETKIQSCCLDNDEHLIISNDITLRKQREQELSKNESRYRELFENAPDAIFIHDPTAHKFLDCNKETYKLFGYTREEILELGPRDITPVYQPDGTKTEDLVKYVDEKIRKTGSTIRVEHTFLIKGGEEIPCEVTVTRHPIYEQFVTVATVKDLRPRKEAEEREAELMGNLAHLSRINSIFALSSGLAHELNQPLTAITQYCESALSGLEKYNINNSVISSSIDGAVNQSMRAAEIIKDIRHFMSQREHAYSSFQAEELLDDTMKLLNKDIIKNGIETNIILAEELPFLVADQAQIQQILLNVLRNSIEALEAQNENKKITIHCQLNNNEMIEFSIEDTGPGIPDNLLDDFMTPCESTKPNGLGMGLCICNFIVKSNGGKFFHDKSYQPGARFVIRIPLKYSQE